METLAERIAHGPVSELDAIGWAIRLAKRLESLHLLGVAHGSVSPACVITAGQDRNARAYLADVQRTPPSLPFQSPERVLGGSLSAADDVWALAATLYALLTGQSPFVGSNDDEVRQKILAASPAPLAVFDVGDDDLQHILDHAFARDTKIRTASIVAFRRSLEEWHPDPSVASLPPLDDEDAPEDEEGARTMEGSAKLPPSIGGAAGPPRPGLAPLGHAGGPVPRPLGPPMVAPPPRPAPRALPGSTPRTAPVKTANAPVPPVAAGQAAIGGPTPAAPMGVPAAGSVGAPAATAHALMPDADDDEDDARTVMRALAPLMPSPSRNLVGPAAGAPPAGSRRPTATVAMPAAYAAPSSAAYAPAAGLAPAPPAPPRPSDDDDDDDDLRTMMRSPEDMAAGLAAHARAHGPPPAAGTIAMPNEPRQVAEQMPEAATLALPSLADREALATPGAMPRMGGQAQLTPAAGASPGRGGLFKTAPMQAAQFANANGHAASMGNPADPPSGPRTFEQGFDPHPGLRQAFDPQSGSGPGVEQPPAFPSSAPLGPGIAMVTSSGIAPAAGGDLAPAQPAAQEGWSVGRLALAAIIALVVTAVLTFAVLRLRGL